MTPLGVQVTPAKGVTVLTPLEGGVQLAQTLDTPLWCYHNTSVFTVYMLQVSYTTVENCPPVVLHVLVSMWQVMNVAGVMVCVQ